MFIYNDGGKIKCGYNYEQLDCTVRAVAIACKISYKEAHDKLKNWGRKDRHCCYNFKGLLLQI
jgi:hypothetical protein